MLSRSISKWEMVLLIINGVIGAGIFGLPAKAYQLAGIYSLIALLICAVAVFAVVFCFAEVASRFSKTGGPYVYAVAAFGPTPAFITGWLLLLTRFITYAALINLLVTYLSVFSDWFISSAGRTITICGITFLLTWFNHVGVRNTTNINNFFTFAKLIALLLFIVVGSLFINTENFKTGPFPEYTSFSSSVLLLIFAFGGFESVLVNTGEVQNPERNLPFALLTATLLIATFYIFIQLVCIGTLPGLANTDKPLAEAAGMMMGKPGAVIISIGAVCSIFGTLNAIMLAGSRMPYAMSEEKQFPSLFRYVHPKFQTPTWSLLLYAGITLVISLNYTFLSAASISAITRVMIYALVCVAFFKLRKKPSDNYYYHIPYGKPVAAFAFLVCLWLLSSSTSQELTAIGYAMGIGIILYLLFASKRKKTSA